MREFGTGVLKWLACGLALALGMHSAVATPVVYDFEGFVDGTSITNQLSGLSFVNTTLFNAGASLNEAEFPPHSGIGVVTDDGGAITINFATPVFSAGAFFTYAAQLSFQAFDSSNAQLGATQQSLFTENFISSGNAPNEFHGFSSAGGQIARVVITGRVGGGSFVVDDLTVDAGNVVPEPHTLALVVLGLGLGGFRGSNVKRSSRLVAKPAPTGLAQAI